MNQQDLVSIVIPIYNVEEFLRECVDSVLAQAYRNIEVILVDDGSPDQCPEICDRYAEQDSRIQVIHQANSGLSGARNAGIKQAKGKYIAFVDSDDSIKPDFIKKLYAAIVKNRADIAVSAFENQKLEESSLNAIDAVRRILIEQQNLDIVAWNKLYKRSLFTEQGIAYPVGKNNEDTLTTYKLYAAAQKVCYIPDCLYNYRTREDSIVHSTKKLKQLEMRELAAKEACVYLHGGFKRIAHISLLLAHFAYIDHALAGRIPAEKYDESRKWILARKGKLQRNPYLTKKLKLYLTLISFMGGAPYKLFRKICHE